MPSGPIGTVQLIGNANGTPLEVELNTKARRGVIRPADTLISGNYRGSFACCSDNRPWANASTSPPTLPLAILGFANATGGSAYVASIRKFYVTQMLTVAGTGAAGLYEFALDKLQTIAGSGFVSNVFTGQRLRSAINGMPAMQLATGASPASGSNMTQSVLSGAFDGQNIARLSGQMAAGTTLSIAMIDARAGEHPAIFEANESVFLRVVSTPTWTTATTIVYGWFVQWDEYEVYQ